MDVFDPMRAAFQRVAGPVQYGLRSSAISIKDTYQLFHNLNNIRKENLELVKQNRELQGIIVDLKKAEEENKLLREQLQLKNEEFFDKDLLLAFVMGNPNDVTGTSIVLDKGSRQGVEIGNNVIRGNFLVGVVTNVSEERSEVDLVISPDVSITVADVEQNNKTEGLARGDLGTSIKVTRLLPGDEVEEGDVFITSGKDGKFLPGLSVGSVSNVSFESAEPLKTATLDPLVDLSKLDKVFIILGS